MDQGLEIFTNKFKMGSCMGQLSIHEGRTEQLSVSFHNFA